MTRRGPRSDLKRRLAARGSGIPAARRAAFAIGLAGAVLAGPGAPALADQSQMVVATVYQPGGVAPATKSVSLAGLQGCTRYAGPDADLSPSGVKYVFQQSSWSLRTVLECGLNQSVAAITAVEVQKPGGAWEDPLMGRDLSVAGDFAAPGAVPVISDDGTAIVYTRPQRTTTDANAGDQVINPSPAPLALDVYEGPLLSVTVHPGSETVPVGATVSFTASVLDVHGNPADPATLSYTWSLDGTPGSESPGFSRTFASAGRYTITAKANDNGGGGGAGTVQITVGSSQDTTTPGSQNTNTPGSSQQPGAPATGPQQSAGATAGGASGPRNPSQSPAPSKAKTVTHPRTSPPQKTPPAPKRPPPVPTPVPASAPNAGPPVSGPRRSVAPGRRVSVISGRLISNVTLLRPDQSPLVKVVASEATAPSVQRPTRTSILPVLAGALAVVVLLALGAGHQLRWRLRPIRRVVVG